MIVKAEVEMRFSGDEICGDSRLFVFLGSIKSHLHLKIHEQISNNKDRSIWIKRTAL